MRAVIVALSADGANGEVMNGQSVKNAVTYVWMACLTITDQSEKGLMMFIWGSF